MSHPENLPQYGFGPEIAFKNLVDNNVFLFLGYTPRAPTRPSRGSPTHPSQLRPDTLRHLDLTTRQASPCVSASFSLVWVVREALRRYHFGVKHGVEIAVINASAVTERAATVVEMLCSVPANERHTSHEKWYRAAYASQNVLVYGAIPDHAVLASVPLVRVLNNLPSYCLRPRPPAELKTLPPAAIKRVSWTYLGTDANYHHFSGEKSRIFLRAAPEDAVRLALTLLRVWFVWMLHFCPPPQNEPHIFRIAAVTKVRELARAAALWPAPETRLETGGSRDAS
ncbi:hypothetical protein B0H14DRAFT_3513809 [Mycena olivaceomarginata]|nr:hypothetical protein B0H14DRAFT_3513809 [Mycena olivaceomarginata]